MNKCELDTQEHAGSPDATASVPLNRDARGGNNPSSSTSTNGKSPTSTRKIESNRQNSKKSTGPKTEKGKKMVSTNAIKHGFFSKFLLIQHPDGKESQAEYNDFYAEVRKQFQPVDFLEELWTEKISVWSWRLRRLIRCESGQISRALAGHNYEIRLSKTNDATELESESSSSSELNAITDHLFLPEREELDKLLRYEAIINRQLNHAIGELERLQLRRKAGAAGV